MRKGKNLLLSLLVVTLSIAVYKLFGYLGEGIISNDYLEDFVFQVVFAGAALISVAVLKKGWIYRSDPGLVRKGWTSVLPQFFLLMLSLSNQLDAIEARGPSGISSVNLALFLAQMFFIGFAEETLFRGIIQNAFHRLLGEDKTYKVILAAFCTAVCFGCAHLVNGFRPEVGFSTAFMQAVQNIGAGMCFCAVYYRTGKCLWFVILYHAFNDAVAMFMSGRLAGVDESTLIAQVSQRDNVYSLLIGTGFYILIALFLMRPKKIRPLLESDKVHRG